MAQKIECPHCKRILNVTEKAFGQTVCCPACNQPIRVPREAELRSFPRRAEVPTRAARSSASQPETNDTETATLPAGMPPIPDETPPAPTDPPGRQGDKPGAHTAGSNNLLTQYHRRFRPKGEQIKEKMRHSMHAVKNRVAAMKLQHEVKSLQAAVDGQLEILGTLLLTHRPPAVHIQAEYTELSQIQDELGRKEATIESLRQTTGGGSAVKELKREAAELHNRQRAVMAAIGRAAWAARPEMPGAAGAYAALDRLQSSLEAKQGELRVVADATGPLWETCAVQFGTLTKAAIVVGAIGGGLTVLCLLWSLLAGSQSRIVGKWRLVESGDRIEFFADGKCWLGPEAKPMLTWEITGGKVVIAAADPKVRPVSLKVLFPDSNHMDLDLAPLVMGGPRPGMPEVMKRFERVDTR